ncbi:ABC transporter permease [Patescibacteria group bacterium]|nr:ABC transporter permease [Patescibacteria group bacterium]
MLSYFSKYWFDFVWVMTLKEIKARYKRVFLGFIWAILNPIFQMLAIGFIFQFFIPVKIDNYFYFLFAGLLPWNFFSYTFSKCTPLMLNERSLIQKAKFPREALVLSIVFSNLFHFLISLFLFTVLTIFVGYLSLFKLFILFLAILWLVFFTIGISFLLSTLFVRYRDIKFIVQAIIPLWFYATPIIYTRALLPEWVATILKFNPMTGIIELFQFVFISGNSIINLEAVVPGILISLTIVLIGIYLFKRDNQYFDDWL